MESKSSMTRSAAKMEATIETLQGISEHYSSLGHMITLFLFLRSLFGFVILDQLHLFTEPIGYTNPAITSLNIHDNGTVPSNATNGGVVF